MSNVLKIAKKEFTDILNNRMVLLVLVIFTAYIVTVVYDFSIVVGGGRPGVGIMFDDNMGIAVVNNMFYLLAESGTILGVIIGCSAISTERIGRALNTLVAKPVYRDTIINGKILGSLVFLAAYLIFALTIFTSVSLALSGNVMAPFLADYFYRLVFAFVFVLVYISVFLSFSMLISLIVRDQAVAMILSLVAVYISWLSYKSYMARNLSDLFPGNGIEGLIKSLFPEGILNYVQPVLMDTSTGASDAFVNILPDVGKLLLFVVIGLVLSYIVFVKRDVS